MITPRLADDGLDGAIEISPYFQVSAILLDLAQFRRMNFFFIAGPRIPKLEN
jgi:hypothetical protein